MKNSREPEISWTFIAIYTNTSTGWIAKITKGARFTPSKAVVALHEFSTKFCTPVEKAEFEVPFTPASDELLELADQSPPPGKWFTGDEEDLF